VLLFIQRYSMSIHAYNHWGPTTAAEGLTDV
jgi:hypothetical protein